MSKDMKVIDKDGEWFVNGTEFRWAHGEREGVYFEPGVPTKVKGDKWIEGQSPMLRKCDDPTASDVDVSQPTIKGADLLETGKDGKKK